MKKIVFFGSGNGSNIETCINFFASKDFVEIDALFTNNSESRIIEIGKTNQIKTIVFNKKEFQTDLILNILKEMKPDLIILAGFLLKINENLINEFDNKIINLHPSLLPKFGGKGMYGNHVHLAVINSKEKISGITIHFVNSNFDEGEIIEQHTCPVLPTDGVEDLRKKIQKLEHQHFPLCIEKLLLK